VDIADIKGQENAKRALMIAAAGGHNLIMQGSPGAGKTMLAQALASLLPPPQSEEIIEEFSTQFANLEIKEPPKFNGEVVTENKSTFQILFLIKSLFR